VQQLETVQVILNLYFFYQFYMHCKKCRN